MAELTCAEEVTKLRTKLRELDSLICSILCGEDEQPSEEHGHEAEKGQEGNEVTR